MQALHEVLDWLSRENLAREGLYIFGSLAFAFIIRGSADRLVNLFRRYKD